MPRLVRNALTPMGVKNAKPGRHVDGGGLHLVVRPNGNRFWVFRYKAAGRLRETGLGTASGADAVSLAEARDKAAALRLTVKAGTDPLEERKAAAAAKRQEEAAALTFRMIAERHIAANEGSWRNEKHRQQWKNTLATYAYPVIGDLPVAEIDTPHVLKVIEPIWQAKPETADRVRGRIEVILDGAKARGYRTGENPARWRGHLSQILPARTALSRGHYRAMPYEAIPAFMAILRANGSVSAKALEFTILTAARTGEAIGAQWSEIDLERGLWAIPAERMKAGRDHTAPLSPRAVEILRSLQGADAKWVFIGQQGGRLSQMAMAMLLRRLEASDAKGQPVTVHGFRSAFRDWAAECTAYAHEVAEMALAHTIESKVERAYRRGNLLEKRRRLMADWSRYCERPASTGTNVTRLRGI